MVWGLSAWGINKIKIMCPKIPIVLPLKNHWAFQKHSTVGHESTEREEELVNV
jgi:hypothetical protein